MFPSLRRYRQSYNLPFDANLHLPADNTRERRIRTHDAEEGTKVLDANADICDIDGKSDSAESETGENEGGPFLDAVGPYGENDEQNSLKENSVGTLQRKKYVKTH